MHKLWICILMFFLFPGVAPANTEPELVAEAAVLMDGGNGQVLYQKNMHRRMFPASTTKILTAIMAIENGDINDMLTVPRQACLASGSAIGLQEGERVSLEDLLYALMLASANDAAETIACHLAGSVKNFALLMNQKAQDLGARESHFVNPHGLPDPEHYTTAYDLAIITRYAMENPEFRKIVGTRLKLINRQEADRSKGPPQEHLWNHNKLLQVYVGAVGVKTGYTVDAGQCLAAAAERDGRKLIAVILNSQGAAVYDDAKKLLDFGFNCFQSMTVVKKGEKITSVEVKYGKTPVDLLAGSSLSYDFPVGWKGLVEREIVLQRGLAAPLAAGEKAGELVLFADGREIGRVDLVSASFVERTFSVLVFLSTGLIVILVGFSLRVMTRRSRRRPPKLHLRRKY